MLAVARLLPQPLSTPRHALQAMRSRWRSAELATIVIAFWLGGCGAQLGSQPSEHPPRAQVTPTDAPTSFTTSTTFHAGAFHASVHGAPAGTETFVIAPQRISATPINDAPLQVTWQHAFVTQEGPSTSHGTRTVTHAWQPLHAQVTTIDKDGTTQGTTEGNPPVQVYAFSSGMTGKLTASSAVDMAFADDSIVQFTAICVRGAGTFVGFPSRQLEVRRVRALAKLTHYRVTLGSRGQVDVLCADTQLRGLHDANAGFLAMHANALHAEVEFFTKL